MAFAGSALAGLALAELALAELAWRFQADGLSLPTCCLTISSEERETWTADVPADLQAREGLLDHHEKHTDGHVFSSSS